MMNLFMRIQFSDGERLEERERERGVLHTHTHWFSFISEQSGKNLLV